MTDGFLSQEEIDALLNGGEDSSESAVASVDGQDQGLLTEIQKDLLGEIGNISMGAASTALSQIINSKVNITTPVVTLTTIEELQNELVVPNLALTIKYISGIVGENLLIMKIRDSSVIANLMMGGDGKVVADELTELEISAVQEAMNQMIGSSSTAMATMLEREVNISPPTSQVWESYEQHLEDLIGASGSIVKVSFKLTIDDLIDSSIMQIYPLDTAKMVCSIMMGEEEVSEREVQAMADNNNITNEQVIPQKDIINENLETNYFNSNSQSNMNVQASQAMQTHSNAEVSKANFQPLESGKASTMPNNIDLILDVDLNISVVLGKTKKSIKDILALGTGSLIELDRLAEEPVEILVNDKKIAYGEVVVVDENFGVRITSIISGEDRIRSLR